MADKFTVGLVQMKCTTNAEENMTHAIEKIREASKRGAQIIALHELFQGEYFCRTEDPELFNLAEAVPGPVTGEVGGDCEGMQGGAGGFVVRTAGGGRLSQHLRGAGCGWEFPGEISENAYSG